MRQGVHGGCLIRAGLFLRAESRVLQLHWPSPADYLSARAPVHDLSALRCSPWLPLA